MNHASGNKSATKAAASVAASATHSHEIDTLGFKYASIDVVFSPFTAATSAYASVLKVQESDASGSGQADISGLSVTAGAGSTTGANVGAVARFNIDLRGRKRYLTVVTSPGNTVAVVTNARLTKAEQGAYDATTAGVNDYKSL
jgi:hypothetical protein